MTVRLARGGHEENERKVCVMEYISTRTGAEFTDFPPCTHHAISRAAQRINDIAEDEDRQRLLAYVDRLEAASPFCTLEEDHRLEAWITQEAFELGLTYDMSYLSMHFTSEFFTDKGLPTATERAMTWEHTGSDAGRIAIHLYQRAKEAERDGMGAALRFLDRLLDARDFIEKDRLAKLDAHLLGYSVSLQESVAKAAAE